MKRLALLTVALIAMNCSQTERIEDNTMIIKGNIEGLKKGKIFLQQYTDGKLINLDSVEAKGTGKFSFTRKLETPEVFYIYLDLGKKEGTNFGDRLLFFGEPKLITIDSKHELFDVNAKISGSESQKIYEEYSRNIRKFNLRNVELLEKQINAIKENKNTLADSINKVSEKNALRKYLYVLNFALTNPNSYVSPYVVLSDAPNTNIKYLDSIYKTLSPAVLSSKYGKELEQYIQEIKKQTIEN